MADEGLPQQRYAVTLRAEVETTQGFEASIQTFEREGEVGVTWARGFRDGSVGLLVVLNLSATEAAPALTDALLEIRAFPDGRLISLHGAEVLVGGQQHLELFDPLWWMLVPPVPEGSGGASIHSWLWQPAGLPEVRWEHRLEWARENRDGQERSFAYEGQSRARGGMLVSAGRVAGTVRFDRDQLVEHRLDGDREVRTRWPAGEVVQQHRVSISLRHLGPSEGPRPRTYVYDDPAAAREPLALVDGRQVGGQVVEINVALPFVLLPGDAATRAAGLGLR